MQPDLKKEGKIKVPRHVEHEIKDLVDPIVLRRTLLWRAGLGLGVLITLGLVTWFAFFRAPTGDTLLADAVEAAGGMDNWNAIDGGSFTRLHIRYDETGTPIGEETERFYFQKNNDFKILVESDSDYGKVVIGKDDEGYWATKDGESVDPVVVAKRLRMMCDGDFCSPDCAASMAFYRFSMPFKLTDPGVLPAYAGKATLNGAPVSLLEITYEPGVGNDRWVLFVDDESKLIRKIEHYAGVNTDAPPETIYWSDHQTEAGVTFSHRNAYYRSNGTKLEEYVISDPDFTTPIPAERFVRPEKRTMQAASLSG